MNDAISRRELIIGGSAAVAGIALIGGTANAQTTISKQTGDTMNAFDGYRNRYPNFNLTRTPNGILTVKMNSGGGALVLSGQSRDDFPRVFHDIATDPGNEVVILTGSGGTWIKDADTASFGNVRDPLVFKNTHTALRRTLYNLLDIEVPVICAIDGAALINSHFALINDIVLAGETAQFQDRPHIINGLVPADGVQIVYEYLMGPKRARYFLWTGQTLTAREPLNLGLVDEVLPSARLLARANELAAKLLETPSLTRRYTRLLLTKKLKQLINENVPYDMALEGASITASGNPENRR